MFLTRHGKGAKRNTKFGPYLVFAETTEMDVDEKKRPSNTIMEGLTDESVMKFYDMSEILEAGTLMPAPRGCPKARNCDRVVLKPVTVSLLPIVEFLKSMHYS